MSMVIWLITEGLNSITINNTDLQQGQMLSKSTWKADKLISLDVTTSNSHHGIHVSLVILFCLRRDFIENCIHSVKCICYLCIIN